MATLQAAASCSNVSQLTCSGVPCSSSRSSSSSVVSWLSPSSKFSTELRLSSVSSLSQSTSVLQNSWIVSQFRREAVRPGKVGAAGAASGEKNVLIINANSGGHAVIGFFFAKDLKAAGEESSDKMKKPPFSRFSPHGNRVQFRMHRYRCAVARPAKVEDGIEVARDDIKEQGIESAQNDKEEQGDNDEEEVDYPLWMEEDDPTWPEGEDEGYGFQVSQFFERWGDVKVKDVDENGKEVEKENDSDDENDDLSLKWEEEEDQWIVREINFLEWDLVALQDPTPLIVFGFERYGSSGANCYTLLKELETMLKRIIDSRKYPVRAVKFDVNVEQDLAAALKIKTIPTLLFVKAGKMVYRMTGVKSADDLLLVTSHLFYHSTRPDFMDDHKTSESLSNTG